MMAVNYYGTTARVLGYGTLTLTVFYLDPWHLLSSQQLRYTIHWLSRSGGEIDERD